MTAKQKAARAKFKAVQAEAKKLRKKNPKITQAQAVKQAWAISYSKKKAGKKIASPKKESVHKDTKSHNVNIRVVSGIGAINMYTKEQEKKYGVLAAKKLTAKTKKEKTAIAKQMREIASKIKQAKKL